jgi:hypothetical protein
MTDERQQDTNETEALDSGAVRFEPADAEAVGDPAVASVEGETAAHATTEPAFADPVPPSGGWDAEAADDQSPAAADRRGAEQAESPPLAQIGAAFVGAFVAAKLLGKLGGGDD